MNDSACWTIILCVFFICATAFLLFGGQNFSLRLGACQ